MTKTIVVRGKKDIVAVFRKFALISGEQDTSRPRAAEEFIRYISGLSLDEVTERKLRSASKSQIDVSGITEEEVPSLIKITVDIEEEAWEKAMAVFRYVFKLVDGRNPQMPYFLRVAGMACIRDMEECGETVAFGEKEPVGEKRRRPSMEEFQTLGTDEKLDVIYGLLRGI